MHRCGVSERVRVAWCCSSLQQGYSMIHLSHPLNCSRPPSSSTRLFSFIFSSFRSGLEIPTSPEHLIGPLGPAFLTAMLRHGGHISDTASVISVRDTGASIQDGVKGDKAILELEYTGLPRRSRRVSLAGQADHPRPPTRVFAKFNLRTAGPMRLLVEASEVITFVYELLFALS